MFFQRSILTILLAATVLTGSKAEAQTHPDEGRLRAILSQAPENDAARERLSVLLLRSGRTEAALYNMRYLSGRASLPLLRDQAASMVERIEGPTWGWRPIFLVVPSSNLNKGASGDTIYIGDRPFTIDDDSRAKDGVGLTFGAAVWKTFRPSELWRGTISGEASATVYTDSDIASKQHLSSTLSFDRRFGTHDLAFGLTVDAQTERSALKRRRLTPFVSGSYALNESRLLTARLDWSDVHYPQERFRNGPTTRLVLGWRETLSPRTRLHFGLPLATERTGRAHLDNDSVGVSARIERLWDDGALRTSSRVSHTNDSYLGSFPGTTVKREDQVSTFSLEISNSRLEVKGFVPTFRYEYTKSKSNVSLYDYDSHDVQVTFQKKF